MLRQLGIRPYRTLEEDMKLTSVAVSYGGGDSGGVPVSVAVPSATRRSPQAPSTSGPAKEEDSYPRKTDGSYDFSRFTQEQRLQYNRSRRDRIFGS